MHKDLAAATTGYILITATFPDMGCVYMAHRLGIPSARLCLHTAYGTATMHVLACQLSAEAHIVLCIQHLPQVRHSMRSSYLSIGMGRLQQRALR